MPKFNQLDAHLGNRERKKKDLSANVFTIHEDRHVKLKRSTSDSDQLPRRQLRDDLAREMKFRLNPWVQLPEEDLSEKIIPKPVTKIEEGYKVEINEVIDHLFKIELFYPVIDELILKASENDDFDEVNNYVRMVAEFLLFESKSGIMISNKPLYPDHKAKFIDFFDRVIDYHTKQVMIEQQNLTRLEARVKACKNLMLGLEQVKEQKLLTKQAYLTKFGYDYVMDLLRQNYEKGSEFLEKLL